MRNNRALNLLFACVTTAALLYGCGGGGGGSGGGSTVPQPNPTTAPPGGGGTPPPGQTPTPVPTTAPTGAATPTPTPAPLQPATYTIKTSEGAVNGTPDLFSPTFGNTATGGQGQVVDNMPCAPVMYDNGYHIHAYLGVFVNGKQAALPWGVGMMNPSQPDARGFVLTATCYYYTHIHDSSGILHVEDINTQNKTVKDSLHTLGNIFDVWGITVNANQFGPFHGPVRIYTSGQQFRGGGGANLITMASTLQLYTGDPHNIAIYSHEVIFVEIGPTFLSSLPNVAFYIEY